MPHTTVIRPWETTLAAAGRMFGHSPAVTAMSWPEAGSSGWESPPLHEILRRPLPDMSLGDRGLLRALALLSRSQVRVVCGLEHVDAANDPFILVLNHSTRRESILVPAVLMLHRGGRLQLRCPGYAGLRGRRAGA